MSLLGLVAILDPPRPAAATAIIACKQAGIRPLLITGDHPGTARAIATDLGIINAGDPVVDLRDPGTTDHAKVSVYARATPGQKLDIIEDLRAHGEALAMTGDGVNDGPALRRADIGVAMGERGTQVARQAADLVLADDNLDTVVAAVEEGRRVYANIRRFLVYGLSGGAAEIAVMLLGPFAGLVLPLLPAQVLWINLLTHGLPGVALGGEPAIPGAMADPPRPPSVTPPSASTGSCTRPALNGPPPIDHITVIGQVCHGRRSLLLLSGAQDAPPRWLTAARLWKG
ncbi:HAD-IC family P-type ATPase [Nonomuraea sp. NPDC052116]|uniref:HAD-IC family P-type ATPase n=1 Tax=Nonomuraea sp. NPDC052116 TaxID=3155665 RepID=UPI003413B377